MAPTPDRLPYETRLEEFLQVVRDAQRDLAAMVREAIATNDLRSLQRRRMQLARALAVLDQLGAQVDPQAAELVRDAFVQGAGQAATQMIGAGVTAPEIPGAFTGVSTDAVRSLQDQILGRLGESRRTVGRTINDVYARAGRRSALRAVLGAAGSPRTARLELTAELMRDRDIARAVRDGGFGFVDRAGKRWALDTYTEMAVRTTTREAVVQGSLARMAAHGINLARVSTHGNPCEVCSPWQGRLVSLDGNTRDYEGEAVTDLSSLPNGGPPFHPNCRHVLAPVAVRIDQLRREMQRRPNPVEA